MLIKAILIGLITWLSGGLLSLTLSWSLYMAAPLMGGLIVGAILGDVTYGVKVGAAIQMAYIGYIVAGGALPADLALAGYLAVALTMLAKAPPEMGVTFAVTLGFLGLLVRTGKMTLNSIWVHQADKYAEDGNTKGIILMNIVASQIIPFLGYFVPTFLAVYLGADYLKNLMNVLPQFLITGLKVVGTLLPALGLAILLKYIGRNTLLPFMFIGFILVAYLKLDLIAVTIIAASIAILHVLYVYKQGGTENG
ncbi:PTS sugar transporter subunit IIC [Thermoanaerobacter sp. A7A]|uniref:PTS mannose/fructose/sorbose/N-acetylgalactosamine transporter subunit IIC n=1 Tax=Thermoanaerobacter sp. A7A TaxID=1350366 RepID=UPI000413D106|nr:PTS sugar transporter subunit IIC [Thermoanaerobacter sp. A7A]MDI3311421.1 PTS sugar transporter subunit IIC [Thermoanaerobacterium sp.]HHW57614.1 PTS sugar transporter subunit IIC [Clostridia bacterium]